MYDSARAVQPFQLLDQHDGTFTVQLIGDEGLTDDTGGPQQPHDVLSLQENGTQQCRRQGSAGPFERCLVRGTVLVFAPRGSAQHAYLLPYATAIPNA